MLDELASDNSIYSIIKKNSLHYNQCFLTVSSRLGYNFDKTLLHYREDFATYSITILKFVLHTFIKKITVIVFFSALTHHTTKFITYI